jgi:hypothetical protein
MDIWFCFPLLWSWYKYLAVNGFGELDLDILLTIEYGVAMIQERNCCVVWKCCIFFVGLASALRLVLHTLDVNQVDIWMKVKLDTIACLRVIINCSYFPSNFDVNADKFYHAYFSPFRLKPRVEKSLPATSRTFEFAVARALECRSSAVVCYAYNHTCSTNVLHKLTAVELQPWFLQILTRRLC